MGLFAGLAGSVVGSVVDRIIGPFTEIFKLKINKQISDEEMRQRMVVVLVAAFADVEKTHSETLGKTYATFMDAASKNSLMRTMWALALGSQIFVLFWSQFVAPLLYAYGYMDKGWHAGTTGEWSYLLVGALLGLGPLVLRAGPAAPDPDRWKRLIQK